MSEKVEKELEALSNSFFMSAIWEPSGKCQKQLKETILKSFSSLKSFVLWVLNQRIDGDGLKQKPTRRDTASHLGLLNFSNELTKIEYMWIVLFNLPHPKTGDTIQHLIEVGVLGKNDGHWAIAVLDGYREMKRSGGLPTLTTKIGEMDRKEIEKASTLVATGLTTWQDNKHTKNVGKAIKEFAKKVIIPQIRVKDDDDAFMATLVLIREILLLNAMMVFTEDSPFLATAVIASQLDEGHSSRFLEAVEKYDVISSKQKGSDELQEAWMNTWRNGVPSS